MILLEEILTKLNDYLLQFYALTGLERWQLLTIALAVLCFLFILLRIEAVKKVPKARPNQAINFPETIGKRLVTRIGPHQRKQQMRNLHTSSQQTAPQPAGKGWKSTVNVFENSSEKIQQLSNEADKYKRNIEHLKFQLSEMKKSNEQLMKENKKYQEIVNELKQKIADLSLSDKTSKNSPTAESQNNSKNQSRNISLQQNQYNTENPGIQDDSETYKKHGIPLDIQELEAISALVTRLKQNRQIQ